MNMQAQITPQYINQPKDPSWSNGSVKDTAGGFWSVPKAALTMFAQGQPVNITYEQRARQNGQVSNVITAVNGSPTKTAPQPLPPLAVPQMATPQAAPPAQPNDKGMDIFLTGVVQQTMSTGKFGPTDIKVLTLAAKEAWEAAHGQQGTTGVAAMPDGRPAAPMPTDPDAFAP